MDLAPCLREFGIYRFLKTTFSAKGPLRQRPPLFQVGRFKVLSSIQSMSQPMSFFRSCLLNGLGPQY